MTLARVLELASWPDVEACLRRHYHPRTNDPMQESDMAGHQHVYEAMRALPFEPGDGSLIAIRISDEMSEECPDTQFEVHGVKPGSVDVFALDFMRWDTLSGFEVAPATLDTYSPAEIVAHCLHEVTFYGYDQEEIAAEATELLRRTEDLKHGRSTGLSWDDVKSELGLDD